MHTIYIQTTYFDFALYFEFDLNSKRILIPLYFIFTLVNINQISKPLISKYNLKPPGNWHCSMKSGISSTNGFTKFSLRILGNIIEGSIETSFSIHVLAIFPLYQNMDSSCVIPIDLKKITNLAWILIAFFGFALIILLWYIIYCKYLFTFLFLVVSNDPNPITRIISISCSDFPIRSWSVNFLPDPEGIYRKTNVLHRLILHQ